MEIEGGGPVGRVGEYAVDFSVAQLVETSPSFRRWFVERATPYSTIEEYVGTTIHATYAGEGESDIEFGIVSGTGKRHLVMIENKINAAEQPNQFERYYNRGRFRTERQNWDSFSVCLLAPERYVSRANEESVDTVVLYEDVIDRTESLTHDSAAFFQSVFDAAMRKPVVADASETLQKISERVQSNIDDVHLEPVQAGNKSLVFKSTHPDHHDAIGYNVWIVEQGAGGRTKIRLKIRNAGGLTPNERETIKSIISEKREALPGYGLMLDRKTDVLATTIWHDEIPGNDLDETYAELVAEELVGLVAILHPVFVERSLE